MLVQSVPLKRGGGESTWYIKDFFGAFKAWYQFPWENTERVNIQKVVFKRFC